MIKKEYNESMIEEDCIDDEFYINLTNKEKSIVCVLEYIKTSIKEDNNE